MRAAILAFPLVLGLAACAGDGLGDARYNATSIAFVVADRAAANTVEPQAQDYCSDFGRIAVPANVTTLQKDAVATYDCRPPTAD